MHGTSRWMLSIQVFTVVNAKPYPSFTCAAAMAIATKC